MCVYVLVCVGVCVRCNIHSYIALFGYLLFGITYATITVTITVTASVTNDKSYHVSVSTAVLADSPIQSILSVFGFGILFCFPVK